MAVVPAKPSNHQGVAIEVSPKVYSCVTQMVAFFDGMR